MGDDELDTLRQLLESDIATSWSETVDHLRSTNSLEDIGQRLSDGVQSESIVVGVEAAAERVAATVEAGYVDAGKATAKWLDKQLDNTLVTFKSTNDRAAEWARMNRAQWVRETTVEMRDAISQVVSRGVREGLNPRQQAIEIRDAIGLTDKQESYIASYRRALKDGDFADALGRKLKDGRSDKRLRRLMAEGGSLTDDQIDSMVERYRKNWIAHRATVIGRTESLRATHEGNLDQLEESIADGDIDEDDLVREWHVSGRPNTRDSHSFMSGQTRRIGQPFRSGDGNALLYPGDPQAPASETIQCRCTVSTTMLAPGEQVKTPKGFDDQGRKVVDGLPTRAEADKNDDDDIAYSVKIGDIKDKLISLPGGGEDEVRMQSIRDAWAAGTKLPPVRVAMGDDGSLFVIDGRHRLLVAAEDNRRVLMRVTAAVDGTSEGTVSLFDDVLSD